MFQKIFVENQIENNSIVQKILKNFPKTPTFSINKVESYFGNFKKPYLEKRRELNLFLGRKQGDLIKQAPDAYGKAGAPHFYYVHAYNCIYECQYCYLQGHFFSPDIVWFVNHEEIIQQMKKMASKYPNGLWFHAGEYSDSLAMAHITGELDLYHQFCQEHPHAQLELRTKSVNIKPLLRLDPAPNFIVSVSLSSIESAKKFELKVPGVTARIDFLEKLVQIGHPIALHFDPMIYTPEWEAEYQEVLNRLFERIAPEKIEYISIGIVRFPGKIYQEVQRNYPDSTLHHYQMKRNSDGKIGLPRPLRLKMVKTLRKKLQAKGIALEQIYACMEEMDTPQ